MTSLHGAAGGTIDTESENVSPALASKTFPDNDLPNSRGGTRTRDPGIMSAVL